MIVKTGRAWSETDGLSPVQLQGNARNWCSMLYRPRYPGKYFYVCTCDVVALTNHSKDKI